MPPSWGSPEVARIVRRRPSPPFRVAERQSATLTTLRMAPTQLSSASMGRIPAVSSFVAPTPRHLRLGLPLDAVCAVYGSMVGRCLPVPSLAGWLPPPRQRLVRDRAPRALVLASVGSRDFRSAPSRTRALFPGLPRSPCIPSLEGTVCAARYRFIRSRSSQSAVASGLCCPREGPRPLSRAAMKSTGGDEKSPSHPSSIPRPPYGGLQSSAPSHDGPPPECSTTPPDESGGLAQSLIASCPCVPLPPHARARCGRSRLQGLAPSTSPS